MEIINDNQNGKTAYQNAYKKVQEIKGFYVHATIYVLVIGFLIFINLKYSADYLWFLWSAGGWGIGLFFHALRVFNFIKFFGKDWEEKKIQDFMDEEKRQKDSYI
ncbi:MAG: hypothetical protein ACI9XR_000633 [Flavobacterium sp.]|jgi:hypothetical protein